jgi:hypothetical protein
MQRLPVAIALSLFCALAGASQLPDAGQWWTYLAQYDQRPGSIIVDLSLRKSAPMAGYPHLVITASTYASEGRKGLPDPADLGRLDALEARVVATLAKKTAIVWAGSFTYDSERVQYVYVQDTTGIEGALEALYREACPHCKTRVKIKDDPDWTAYRTFLFPNAETIARNHLQLR